VPRYWKNRRADVAHTFEITVEFFPSRAKLVHGSMRVIERETIVKWNVDCAEFDPQEIQSMREHAVKNWVEKIGESIAWGSEQEVPLSRFDDWKQEYVRIEDGEDIVDAIDRQDGWATKYATFHAELVDLKCDSRVGYVPSKLALQMVEDDWAAQRLVVPIVTELTVVLTEEGDANEQARYDSAEKVLCVDWNTVELNARTDLAIAPISDIEMAKLFGIPVDT
jgi:hypothetical protein